ncbi:MAG: phosphoribosylglycinamide formyltransferase [Polyangiaceae bacterium]|nr:phosphoribosylglycinamide formyltransferase [Polyangiaceae bacterium]
MAGAALDLGVLISGSGTNLGAILAAIEAGRLNARVRVVVSNKADAGGLTRAQNAGVPTKVVSHKDYGSREAFDAELVKVLHDAGAQLIVLAGFMRVVTPVFLEAFRDRVVNIHPALLPAFPGVDAQAQALAYGCKVTGCTVHFVDTGVDTGPIILQEAVPVLEGDDRARLAERLLVTEHALLVRAIDLIAKGRVTVKPSSNGGRRRVSIGADPA